MIRFAGVFLCFYCLPLYSLAEITLDGSLGSKGPLTGPAYQLDASQGLFAGNNLFHSFEQFNLNAQESLTFTGDAQTQNLINRVTGGFYSLIDGEINTSAMPDANFYLINPAGIFLGGHAQFDIGGGLHLSTADYLSFADGIRFPATATTPTSSLSFSAPQAFGFLTAKPAGIRLNGFALQLNNSQPFSLVGGNIQANFNPDTGANLIQVPAGSVTLFSAQGIGEVPIHTPQQHQITANGLLNLSDTSISTGGAGDNGGDIRLFSGALALNRSTLTSNAVLGQTGSIFIQALQSLDMQQGEISVKSRSSGQSGNIDIRSPHIEIHGGQIINSTQFRPGGKINIEAATLQINQGSFINSQAESATAGDIHLQAAQQMLLSGESTLLLNMSNNGDTGQIQVNAPQLHVQDGATLVTQSINGQAREIGLNASYLSLNSATLDSLTLGDGQAGNIALHAGTLASRASSIRSRATTSGDAGHIGIQAGSADFSASLVESQSHTGLAGGLNIQASQLHSQSSQFSSNSFAGQSGTLNIYGGDINVQNSRLYSSGMTASDTVQVQANTVLNANNSLFSSNSVEFSGLVQLQAPVLNLQNTAVTSLSQSGSASGVNLLASQEINLNRATIALDSKTTANSRAAVTVRSPVLTFERGASLDVSGGSLNLDVDSLNLNNAYISVRNRPGLHTDIVLEHLYLGPGGQIGQSSKGGLLAINATAIELQGGSIINTGPQADLQIQAQDSVLLRDNAQINGQGTAFLLRSPKIQVNDSNIAGISGSQSDWQILTGQLMLQNGGHIGLKNEHGTQGGNLDIQASDWIHITGRNALGRPASLDNQAVGAGAAGVLSIKTPELRLQGGNIEADSTGAGAGGKIHIQTQQLELSAGSVINSNSLAQGAGGAIVIEASEAVRLSGLAGFSSIQANTRHAPGGSIDIQTPVLQMQSDSALLAESVGTGDAGSIQLQVQELALQKSARISVSTAGSGSGGDLQIAASEQVTLQSSEGGLLQPAIRNDTHASGQGGTLSLSTKQLNMSGGDISILNFGSGNAGQVNITAEQLEMAAGASINASSAASATGAGGNVNVSVSGKLSIHGQRPNQPQPSAIGASTFGEGRGGATCD
ncbi:two-partner secretion domain-containing protein [Candidatus Venteria ishoeyi]|uniref:Haemagglutination activity domain protein n=1 Tax=Candidatus Venteria ishoeyi TaxID=1899563 RepID=A0A1H6FIK4_9GAMM|nr:filamentous hemagglutinin N-terminal domain-containing protein [Candidatus Venteria ishoeyi]SEH08844.1 haemagglutination activity domain protein [Candidatus Venteria ishoeyi]